VALHGKIGCYPCAVTGRDTDENSEARNASRRLDQR
jgi:hypothetical protein